MNVAIFVILIVIMPKIKKQGQLFACFLMLYACGRFGLEFFRGDYNDSHYFSSLNLTVAHLTGLLVLPVGAFLFHWQGKWGKDRDFLQPADDNE